MERNTMIKIDFCDMYMDFDKNNNIFSNIIKKNWGEYELSDKPDFLIYGPFGINHYKYRNCVKIFFTGEAVAPDFNFCDYAIGFEPIQFGNRYMKRPIWLDEEQINLRQISDEEALNRKFCNFVYSNDKNGPGALLRKQFAKELMKYKHVDCPGSILNNMQNAIGGRCDNWRKDKIDFVANYKFTIAFENSNYDGYTTEKMTQPIMARSIPIYWGNPSVEKEFNKDAFINANNYENNFKGLIDLILEIDNNDELYLKMLHANPMSDTFDVDEMRHFEEFIISIIERGNHPYTKDPLLFSKRMSVDNLSRKEKIKYFLCKRR